MIVNEVTPNAITAEAGFTGRTGQIVIIVTFDFVDGVPTAINIGEHLRHHFKTHRGVVGWCETEDVVRAAE